MSPEGRIDRYSYAGEVAFGNADVETYGELLEMAMADGELAANESMRLEEYRRRHGITMEQHNQLVNQLQHGLYSTTTTAVTGTAMASSSATSSASSNDTRAFSTVSASRSLKRNPSSANSYLAASSAASRLNLSSARGPAPVAVAAAAVDETQDAPPTIDSIVAAAQAEQQLEEQEQEWEDVTAEPGTEMSASEALSRLSVKAEEI